jgi:hypothetical protein
MKTYALVLFFRNIPIWRETIQSDEAHLPNVQTVNQELKMFGDKLVVREINSRFAPMVLK